MYVYYLHTYHILQYILFVYIISEEWNEFLDDDNELIEDSDGPTTERFENYAVLSEIVFRLEDVFF